MKIIFMGSGDIAVPTLKKLITLNKNKEISLQGVFTSPDKNSGRGLKVKKSKLINLLTNSAPEVSIYQPIKLKNSSEVQKLLENEIDLIIVMAYGFIISKNILDHPKLGCINVHTSLLPKYRGASPIQETIKNDDKETGITIMYMDEGLDTGDIISSTKIKLELHETGESLQDKLSKLSPQIIEKTIIDFKNKKITRTTQNNANSSYAKKIKKENGEINWNDSAVKISSKIHAYHTWPGTYTFFNLKNNSKETRVKIYPPVLSLNKLPEKDELKSFKDFTSAKPKHILANDSTYLYVKCGSESILAIQYLQVEGKKIITAPELIRGYPNLLEN